MTVLLLLSGAILFRMEQSMLQTKIQTENRISLDSAVEMIQYLEGLSKENLNYKKFNKGIYTINLFDENFRFRLKQRGSDSSQVFRI